MDQIHFLLVQADFLADDVLIRFPQCGIISTELICVLIG